MISQKQKMKMQQKLTPQQLLLMKLLQLPVTALELRIKEEVEKNPMLDMEGGFSETNAADNPGAHNEITDNDEDFRGIDISEYFDDDDYEYREHLEKDRNVEERHYDIADGTSFTESLLRQLELRNLSDTERTIGEEIIGSLDSTGYLGRSLQLIANDMAFRSGIEVNEEEMEKVLREIQSFDPAGIGARSLQECMSLQLHRIPNPDNDTILATEIVDKYFSQLSNRHYAALMSLLKIPESQMTKILAIIKRLNPKPGWGIEDESRGSQYIIPDFIVTNDNGNLSLSLNVKGLPSLHINREYNEMLKELSHRKKLSAEEHETLQFIKTKTDAAQWLIDTLQQRQQTMTATMTAIMKRQRAYLISGDSRDLKPMRLKDVADDTGYDESTISRVASQKYVQTNFGTFLLKEMFSKAVVTEEGEVIATEHVKEVLKQIVSSEDKSHPLTDEAIAKALQDKGFSLSRRTVTKYRESMGIPVGRMRREV
ncbi:MAG: RNA polymerase factor sigma-54 [Bacteroidales bacterium]|nr:RNA polymerase factor sigma-54 [Bacteroidales bacterium]